jgi:phosphoribosylglycinamide formyltransferase 2
MNTTITAFNPKSLHIMILGNDERSQGLITALQKLGITSITVIPSPQTSTSLSELIAQVRPQFFVPMVEMSFPIDIEPTVTVIPNSNALGKVMNRRQLRQLAAEELDLPTARYAFAKSYNELQFQINRGIGYPCIVKPIISTGGKGHSVVKEAEEVKPAWELAITIGGMTEMAVMVEEFIQFDYEMVQLTVRAPNAWGEIVTHFCEPIGYLHKEGHYVESWQPQQMTPTALHQSREMAKKITAKLGDNSLFALEFLVKGDHVWFNELTPYPHRAGMVTMMTQGQNQFDLHARAFLGLPVDTTCRGAGASTVIYSDKHSDNLTIEGMPEALSVATADIYLFQKEKILPKQPLGITLASGQNIHEARQRANAATSRIRVAQ